MSWWPSVQVAPIMRKVAHYDPVLARIYSLARPLNPYLEPNTPTADKDKTHGIYQTYQTLPFEVLEYVPPVKDSYHVGVECSNSLKVETKNENGLLNTLFTDVEESDMHVYRKEGGNPFDVLQVKKLLDLSNERHCKEHNNFMKIRFQNNEKDLQDMMDDMQKVLEFNQTYPTCNLYRGAESGTLAEAIAKAKPPVNRRKPFTSIPPPMVPYEVPPGSKPTPIPKGDIVGEPDPGPYKEDLKTYLQAAANMPAWPTDEEIVQALQLLLEHGSRKGNIENPNKLVNAMSDLLQLIDQNAVGTNLDKGFVSYNRLYKTHTDASQSDVIMEALKKTNSLDEPAIHEGDNVPDELVNTILTKVQQEIESKKHPRIPAKEIPREALKEVLNKVRSDISPFRDIVFDKHSVTVDGDYTKVKEPIRSKITVADITKEFAAAAKFKCHATKYVPLDQIPAFLAFLETLDVNYILGAKKFTPDPAYRTKLMVMWGESYWGETADTKQFATLICYTHLFRFNENQSEVDFPRAISMSQLSSRIVACFTDDTMVWPPKNPDAITAQYNAANGAYTITVGTKQLQDGTKVPLVLPGPWERTDGTFREVFQQGGIFGVYELCTVYRGASTYIGRFAAYVLLKAFPANFEAKYGIDKVPFFLSKTDLTQISNALGRKEDMQKYLYYQDRTKTVAEVKDKLTLVEKHTLLEIYNQQGKAPASLPEPTLYSLREADLNFENLVSF